MNQNQAILAVAALLIIVLVGLSLWLNLRDPEMPIALDETPAAASSDNDTETTLAGTYECLPHKGPSQVITLECMFGLVTDDGSHYAIDPRSLPAFSDFSVGEKVTVTGVLTPTADLDAGSALHSYDIRGAIAVSEMLQASAQGLRSSFTLRLGETMTKSGVTVKALSVEEDSRCPIDVQCIQAGTVRVKVELAYGTHADTRILTLDRPVTISGVTGTLSAVMPEKRSMVPLSAADYLFAFSVEAPIGSR